ncbi:TniQ family protein [Cupriavidus pinatubonensis]|nr:TniQ family protein [Cupriavidus pinatubonensis]
MSPFPKQDEIAPGEDGMGYALRMATMNGLTFHDLARHLASPGHLSLPVSSINAIAFMFGCPREPLRNAFVVRHFRAGNQAAYFLGHLFLRTYLLRQARPQLCPVCVGRHGRARAAWSISLLTACVFHGVRLIDRCVCSRPILWRRPSIDLCECGLRLTDEHQGARPADTRELSVSGQIEYLLGSGDVDVSAPPIHAFPEGFDNVTIDTFVRLIWIFGIVDDLQIDEHPKSTNRRLQTVDAGVVACLAYDRLSAAISSSYPARRMRLVGKALCNLYDDVSTPADATLISSLASRLQELSASPSIPRLIRKNRQLSLFEDDHDPIP